MAGNLDFRLNLLANTTGLQKGMDSARFALNALAGAMAALGVGLGIRELAQAADSYTNLSARINIATKDGGDFTSAMAGVHQVALATNSSLDATGSLFTRLNTVGKEMGMTQQNTLDLTKTINQAIQTSGGTAEAGEAAITQLIQAMQGGVLRGEEFNSIMENGYGVAEALAKGLGVTTGELRKMAENGELGAERVYKALLSQKDAVQQTYDSFPLTVSNALQKIATSWQILIGEVDQANGASATAAQWLSTLADNMSLLKPIIDDIGDGFTRFSEYYSSIYDQDTIDSLKATLISVYDTIKTLFNTVLEVGEAFHDVFSDALSNALSFTDGLYPAGEQVSGFQKFIDLLNIALGFLSDGFKTIGIGVNLFTGTLYGLLAVWYELKSKLSWGEAKEEAIANMEAMRAKSEEYFTKGFDGAKNFESKTIETIQNIGKTDKEKNQERLADSQQTLDQLKAQEEKHKADYKAISDARIQAEQQLFDARKTGNQAAIDLAVKGLADIDAKEKAYQAESKKITDDKIKAAQDWVNAQLTAADGTQKAADAATQKTLQTILAAQGLKLEFDGAGKAIVKAMDDGTKATEGTANAADKARKAAASLGIDLDVALNRVSEKFASDQNHLNSYAGGLEAMGVTGARATELIYQGWEKWAEQAKSPAEIDAAKAQLLSFEKQGVFSAKQVQMGMEHLDQVNGKLPQNISEVEKAYKLLGITSRKEAGEAADAQMKAFNVLKQSGTASVEELRQALINMADKIYASGDAAKIAAYEAKLAYHGLSIQVSETGQVSVKANNAVEESLHRVRNATGSAGDGFDDLGRRGVANGNATRDAWEEARQAAMAAANADENSVTNRGMAGRKSRTEYTLEGVKQGLRSKGYTDEKEINRRANELFNTSAADRRSAIMLNQWEIAKDYPGMLPNSTAINIMAAGNKDYIDLMLQKMSPSVGKTGSSNLNNYAPSIPSAPSVRDTGQPSKEVTYNFDFDGKQMKFNGPAGQESLMSELVNQLKIQAKST